MAVILANDGLENEAAAALEAMGHTVDRQTCPADKLPARLHEVDVLIVRSATKVTRDLIDEALAGGRLRLVIRAGVGLDNIDTAYAHQKGLAVTNTPAASSRSVAELAIGHMFAVARHVYAANVSMRQGLWEKKKYEGIELCGKTLGLVGFGRIAQETGRIAAALGMRVLYYTRSGEKDGFAEFVYMPLDELLAASDFVSVHVPYDKAAGPLLDRRALSLMRRGAYLINCARGGVVDEEAMLDALDEGHIAAAGVDVFADEPTKNERLYTHPRVSLTPHIGASTKEAQTKIGQEIVDIIRERLA